MKKSSLLFFLLILSIGIIQAQFGLKTSVFSTKPLAAKITYEKDGATVGDLYKVFYEKDKSDGTSSNVSVGHIMAFKIGSLTLKNRKTSLITDGGTPLTVFKKIGVRKIEKGMEIKKIKRNWASYGAEYSFQKNTFFSGPTILATAKAPTGGLSVFITANLKFSTSSPLTYNGLTKNYDIKSWGTIGLRGEKVLLFLNYFQFSAVIGAFGTHLNVNNIGKTSINSIYADGISSNIWCGFGGLKLALNAGPRVQFFLQDFYTAQLSSAKWDMTYYPLGTSSTPSLETQLKNNLNFNRNSLIFGIRIR